MPPDPQEGQRSEKTGESIICTGERLPNGLTRAEYQNLKSNLQETAQKAYTLLYTIFDEMHRV